VLLFRRLFSCCFAFLPAVADDVVFLISSMFPCLCCTMLMESFPAATDDHVLLATMLPCCHAAIHFLSIMFTLHRSRGPGFFPHLRMMLFFFFHTSPSWTPVVTLLPIVSESLFAAADVSSLAWLCVDYLFPQLRTILRSFFLVDSHVATIYTSLWTCGLRVLPPVDSTLQAIPAASSVIDRPCCELMPFADAPSFRHVLRR
jgi:hypothetical protein